jgi:competence protein ComEC
MGRWILPAAAAAFWTGILLAGPDARPLGGPAALVAGGAVVAAVAGQGLHRRAASGRTLRAAGLEPRMEPPGPRDRILAAAGFTPPAPEPRASPRIRAAVVVSCVLLGAGWIGVRSALRPRLGALEGRFVEYRGTAAADVRRYDWGWGVEVALDRATVEGRECAIDVRAWVSGSGPAPALQAGQPLRGTGSIQALRGKGSGFDATLLARGVTAWISGGSLSVRGPPSNPALRMAGDVRDALRRGATVALPAREAALLLGLSIGDTEQMPAEVEEDFRASGLAHLLAVSGSNVAMFLVPVLALAAWLGLRIRSRVAVAAAAIVFFAVLTRWEPSVLRAGAMAAVALVGIWAGRPRSTGALLGASVGGLLVVDPWLATSVGFQLSAAATAGLALLASPVAARLSWMPRPVALATAATAAAQAGVTPLLLLHFGVVPIVTLLANVLAFPAVAAALLLGLLAAGAGLAWVPLGHLVGIAAAAPLGYLIGLADRMARFPLPSLTGDGVGLPAASAALAMLLAWRLRRGRRPIGAVAVVLSVATLAWSSVPMAGPPAGLTITFLDVGQGDAAVVRTPEGGTVVIDAGPDPEQVAAELAALGIRRIDLAVGTHAHADHVEGFPAVLARFPVGLMVEPGCPGDSPSYARFVRAIRNEDVLVRHPRGGDRLWVGDLEVDVLGPDRCSPGGESPNDESVVLRLRYGDHVMLFPGDAEVPAQRDMIEDGDPLRADVLKVPHHGGDTNAPEFLDAVDASVGVVSVGPNDYGHPNAGVLAALRAEGMTVYRTDVAGDVTVWFGAQGVLVESAEGEP